MRNALLTLTALLLAAMTASAVMVVNADEVAVVMRLGAVQRTVSSGLAFRLPWPIEDDERVQVTEVRRAEPGQSVLLTGDTNLVSVDIVAQYTVSDPVWFVTASDDPDALVSAVLGAWLVAEVSAMDVDVLLTTGRAALEQQMLAATQHSLDALQIGVRLEAVELRALEPPDAVVAAFNDVSSARGDRDTMVLSAQTYASQKIPEVRGETAQMLEVARTDAAEQAARTRADIARFEALLPTWSDTPDALRQQLQHETGKDIHAAIQLLPPGGRVVVP